jgi:uncharacterized protein (DUF111 family)
MIDTVKRMIEAGIDDATILSTLVDAGLSQEEASQVLEKVKSNDSSPPKPINEAPQQDVQLLRSQVENQAQQQELNETTTQNMLNIHEQKLDDVTKKVNEVKEVVSSQAKTDPALSMRISNLEQKVEECNASTKACLALLQKVLETDRKILTELEAGK